MLCLIDGAKAPAAAIKKVFGDTAVLQPCVLYKRRNVAGHLPKDSATTIDRRLALVFAQPEAVKRLGGRALANEIEAEHPPSAASLRDELNDMFSVRRLGVAGTLSTRIDTTNCIESMNSIVRRTSGRVTKWKDCTMKKRWISAGMLEAERSFRRVRGYKGMDKLVDALRREMTLSVTPAVVTPEECNQAAA